MTEFRKRPVYAVATSGYTTGLNIITLHTEYEEAFDTWNAVRIGMIWEYEGQIETAPHRYSHVPAEQLESFVLKDYHDQIGFLSCEDPKTIHCKCADTPIIVELLLEEPVGAKKGETQ